VNKIIQTTLNKGFDLDLHNSGINIDNLKFIKKIIYDFYLDSKGIIREESPKCPHCGSIFVVANGYTSYENKLFTSFGIKISKGQYLCKTCNQGYIVELPAFNEMSNDFKNAIKSLITSLRIKNISYSNIAEVIKDSFGYMITSEGVRNIFETVEQKIRTLTTYCKQSGYYSYDAQYLKINGRQFYRHAVHDVITGNVLIDVVLPKQNNKTIKQIFLNTISSDKVKAFIVDMAIGYPNLIKECYGPNVKVQWCLFHLFQDIGKKYKGCKKETKDSSFQNELNKQFVFDVIYPRQNYINFLNQVLKWLKVRRDKLSHLDTKILEKVMKETRAYFWKKYRRMQHKRKKNAKKNGYNIVQSLEQLEIKFSLIFDKQKIYPKKIKNVIVKMKKNWDKIVACFIDKNIPTTNNIAERYFGKTCSKNQKKSFRSIKTAQLKCKIHFLQENGEHIFEPFSIFNLVRKYSFFFENCAIT
jgi:hypothetical protein